MPNYTALVTLLAVAFYYFTAVSVARARTKYGIQPPATVGHPDFERMYRIQENTLEWMPIFLPSLWLFALYVSDIAAAVIGVIWIFGRILYFRGYAAAAEKRLRGFGIQAFAASSLFVGALVGVIAKLVALT